MNQATLKRATPALRDTGSVLRRSCGCGGACASCQDKSEEKLQRSMAHSAPSDGHNFSRVPVTRAIQVRVGPADDAHEREADRIADAVSDDRSAEWTHQHPAAGRLQRALDDDADLATDKIIEEAEADTDEDDGDESGRPKFEPGASRDGGVTRVPIGSSGGDFLPSSVRAPFESRMGGDFSTVRVHADRDAARAAASVRARAFTVGSDIYFASGRYDVASRSGRHLLAHELAHVMQQSSGGAAVARRKPAARKAPATKAKAEKLAPCAPDDFKCDGKCAAPSNKTTVHPACGNETCAASSAVDPGFFIRHLDVNLSTQMTTAEWGDSKKTLSVSRFLTSPNPSKTPPGSTTIGIKCSACHTNRKGAGMGWFASFKNGFEFGFHNSQAVGPGVKSHGCIRVAPCSCAKEIHDNTDSGTTTVCIHKGTPCHPLPTLGDPDKTHKSSCSPLFQALPPKPTVQAPGKGKAVSGGDEQKPAKKKATPPAPPNKTVSPVKGGPAANDIPIAAEDVSTEEEFLIAAREDRAEEEVA
jgi:hypothetical protein